MTKKKLFGTDGIRGHVDSVRMQPKSMQTLASVIGQLIKDAVKSQGQKNASVLIGRDTRASGPEIEKALIAGFLAQKIECQCLGVLPTSLLAHHTRKTSAALGIMISASHNPFHDNGLKFFDAQGLKISSALEQEIEGRYFFESPVGTISPPATLQFKSALHQDALAAYRDTLKDAFALKEGSDRIKVIIDCANGAASHIAPAIFIDFGFSVFVIGASPDGYNINRNFGSEAPDTLRDAVIKRQADLGIAFDGDADRVIFVDEGGNVIDGDAILALLASNFKRKGQLAKHTVVATVMSSMVLDRALAAEGISVSRTEVGDKFVVRHMLDQGYSFGGENSGHLIKFPEATTGDGIFSALHVLDILQRAKIPASRLVRFFEPTPKLLRNIDIVEKIPFDQLPKTQALIDHANQHLNSGGRVMMRYSGTENKARLLVEAPSNEECHRIANTIFAEYIRELLAFCPQG